MAGVVPSEAAVADPEVEGRFAAPASIEYANLAQSGSAPPLAVPPTRAPQAPTDLDDPRDPERTSDAPAPVPLPGVPSGLGLRKFRDRLVIPPVLRAWQLPQGAPLRIRARVATVRLHADLPAVDGWTYEGTMPGPTIEVRRGHPAIIDWENDLGTGHHAAHLPFDVVRVPPISPRPPGIDADFATAMKPGGRSTTRGSGTDAYPALAGTEHLRAATVVHLHGALTDGHNDGWAHNVTRPGGVTRCRYPNDQEATTLWYHDHTMAVTRFNVYAGLAGCYLIRDQHEAELRLPDGDFEIPLVIADRNLETAPVPGCAVPVFTGRMIYKQAGFSFGPGLPEGEIPVTGPFTMVNGTIWPTLRARPRWYRLRLLNATSSRILRLALHDTTDEQLVPDGAIPPTDPAFTAHRIAGAFVVIGTDGGLLPAPYAPTDGVIEMGPGERVDVLVDLGAHRGRTLELRNENGTVLGARPGQADATAMQIVVAADGPVSSWTPPAVLNPSYRRYEHLADGTIRIGAQVIPSHEHVWVGVIPPGIRGGTHPELWELAAVPPGEPLPARELIQVTRDDGSILSLHPVAKLFDDATTIFLPEGSWAVWHLLHLGGPDHPMHIHMTEFQMIARRQFPITRPGGNVPQYDASTASTSSPLPVPGPGRPIDPMTAGMKDTWVLKAGEWVSVLGDFSGATGSFMYHCHILDHEDHTMMRPFVVLPSDILAFHRGHGGAHH